MAMVGHIPQNTGLYFLSSCNSVAVIVYSLISFHSRSIKEKMLKLDLNIKCRQHLTIIKRLCEKGFWRWMLN